MNQKLKGKIMKIKRSEVIQLANKYIGNDSLEAQNQIMLKIATARCARLSYMTFEGKIDYAKDIALHDTLLKAHHMSPFEHCAKAPTEDELNFKDKGFNILKGTEPYSGNFNGWIQYRQLIETMYE